MRIAESGRALALAGLAFLVGMEATAATAEAVRLTASHQRTNNNSDGTDSRDTRDGVDQHQVARRGSTERVSVDSAGNQGNRASAQAAISANGRFVAFRSDADNLVPGDTNNFDDLFVHDRNAGAIERVNVDSTGMQSNHASYDPEISADGRFVAFVSWADNLVPGDTNNKQDIFVHDRTTGVTKRVSVDSSGNQGNDFSYDVAISANGRFVAFASYADNLVHGDTNGRPDVFVRDRKTRVVERVNVDSAGNQDNGGSYGLAISANARFVAFRFSGDNLVPGDTNGRPDVFVRDRKTRVVERVNVDSAGNQDNDITYDPAISADGRFVAFSSFADNLVPGDTNRRRDVFVHDRKTGVTERVSVDSAGNQGNYGSDGLAISGNGRFVASASWATNLVHGDSNGTYDVFVHDRKSRATERVSVDSAGNQGNNHSYGPAISADGRFIAFSSGADNLVPGDTNGAFDVFVHDRRARVAETEGADLAGE